MPLKLHVVSTDLLQTKADLLAIGVFEDSFEDSPLVAACSQALEGSLDALLKREDFKGKKDQKLLVHTLGKLPAARVLFLGLGLASQWTDSGARLYAASAARAAITEKAASLALTLPDNTENARVRYVAEGAVLGAYRFTKYFTGDRRPKTELTRISLLRSAKKAAAGISAQRAAELGVAIAQAVNFTRDLQNEPPNELTPSALAQAAQQIAKEHGLKVTVLDRRAIERAGMKLFAAVAQGSTNEPRMVHMVYSPAKRAKRRIAVIGKGLTFDSGGLCIKPAQGMGEMKTDMSGAANVVGLMVALAALRLPIEVHGILGCAENMPDGNAYRPGDVFGSLDGKTVEIINTDAEGRLVLADCLTYAKQLNPDIIVNNATLTGACIVALGSTCSGFYATNDELADTFSHAAKEAGEQFWRMPLLDDLRDALKSDIADLKHVGDRYGGSITAALFLREFVGDVPFIHCDIAGPSLASRAYGIYPKGGTGHGVLTFLQFLENQSQ